MKELTAYCLDWHIKNSEAFYDILVEPLRPYAQINLTSWDGADDLKNEQVNRSPIIFCMLPPPESLLKNKDLRLIWIPMWDQAQGYSQDWWNKLPKSLRVVAFSQQVANKANAAGLQTLQLQFFKDTGLSTPVSWQKGNILFYWNRVGMVGPTFLEKLCEALEIDELLFKPAIDPRIENNKYYELPDKLGQTKVSIVQQTKTREKFLKSISGANIILSPRLTEGVGMVFIEAMSRGCAVIAHNAPTMNEYIQNNKNGLLLNAEIIKKRIFLGESKLANDPPFLMSYNQPWKQIRNVSIKSLGDRALLEHKQGFEKWKQQASSYASFIID